MSDTCPLILKSLSIIVMDSPNLTGWLIKMIKAEEMFESIDHCATNAIPTTVKTEVIKVNIFACSTPQIAIKTITSIIKIDKFANFKIGLILYFE